MQLSENQLEGKEECKHSKVKKVTDTLYYCKKCKSYITKKEKEFDFKKNETLF